MNDRPDNAFEPRLGRIRSGGNSRRGRTFMSKVARSVSRAGHIGRPAYRRAGRYGGRTHARRVVVKARFIRTAMSSPRALAEHLRYISRDSAVRGEDQGRIFDQDNADIDQNAFAEAAKDDRHHFRLIVSPEDGAEMSDLKPFVRDLVSNMENDLGTKLNWVAAVHDNTDYPHAHIVIRGKRDDGRDLVMPRAYISHGIRERAEELVTLELGPETQFERDVKIGRQTGAERLTPIDRSLSRLGDENGVLNLANAPVRYRSINAARLRTLNTLGLAEKTSGQRWQLADGFERTLNELGERRDIIKQLHRALGKKTDRAIDPARPFSGAAGQVPVTGAVLRKGLRGEGHDEPFVMIDGTDGRAVVAAVNASASFADLRPGMIITLSPQQIEPRPSDHTVASVAAMNNGVYSALLHHETDPRSTPAFITTHIRRLEALRRAGLVERQKDGSWLIPSDFLDLARNYQERTARISGAKVNVESWTGLSSQIDAQGLTWLDQVPPPASSAAGFGEEVRLARMDRRKKLVERGIIHSVDENLRAQKLHGLRRLGEAAIADELSKEIGKGYKPMPNHGSVDGIYRKSIVRPEGKFAVIERQKTFTIAPWRRIMERAKGQAISGVVRGERISWNIGRKKGLGR